MGLFGTGHLMAAQGMAILFTVCVGVSAQRLLIVWSSLLNCSGSIKQCGLILLLLLATLVSEV